MRFLLVMICSSLFLLPAGMPGVYDYNGQVTLGSSPNLTVNLSKVVNLNVSYRAVIIAGSFGVLGASFNNRNWSLTSVGGNYSYSAQVNLVPFDYSQSPGLDDLLQNLFYGNIPPNMIFNFPTQVYVNMTRYSGSISSLEITNSTYSTTSNVSNVSGSTLEISFSLVFKLNSLPISRVYVILVQSLKASIDNSQFNFNRIAYDYNHRTGEGLSVAPGSEISGTKALYWWTPNVTYNGNQIPSKSFLKPISPGYAAMLFLFALNPTIGHSEITQDPFVSIPGLQVSKIPITLPPAAVNFLRQHAEFLTTGLILGTIVIAATYAVYRRHKIRI